MAVSTLRGKSYGPAVSAEVAKWNRVIDSLRAEVLEVVRAGGEVRMDWRRDHWFPHPFDPDGIVEPGLRSVTFYLPAKPRKPVWRRIPGPKPKKGKP